MTMKELAQIAGVSTAAVSRYINGGPISQEKRERIRIAIEKTGYQPDAAAQALRTGVTDLVGFIVPKINSDSVARAVSGAAPVLAEAGFFPILADTANDINKELTYLSLFQSRQVAGIIMLATFLTPQLEDELQSMNVPIVVVGQRFRHVPCVYHDDFGAAYDLTNLILEKGRGKLAFISVTEQDAAVGQERRKGVEAAMNDYGMDPSELMVEYSDFTVEGGRRAMETLLEKAPDIDGVICAIDQIAIGAMEVLRAAGRDTPRDVSVVGMDDNWADQFITPRLTSAHFYYKTSGGQAAKMLLELIRNKGKRGPVHQMMLGYSVEERDSV